MSNGDTELAALVTALDLTIDEEVELGHLVGRFRAIRERAIRDQQAAELLPLGRVIAAERLGVAPSTVYKMTNRHRVRFSTAKPAA